jgi:hypothetical protein
VALVVIGLVVLVAGIVIYARGGNDEPQRATPSDEEVIPVDTAAEEVDADSYTPVGDTYPSWDDFPYDFRSSFLGSCTGQGDYDRCLCALETMESRYTIDEVLEILDAEAYGEDVTWFYSDITSSCF